MSDLMVHKVTLSSGKEVLLRALKIKHQRLAAEAASGQAGNNATVLGIQMLEEILKLLVLQVDGKTPEPAALEDLDNIFSYPEYQELLKVVGQLMGENGTPKMEVVSSGGA